MSQNMNANGFGTKGADQRPVTFGESLLSGRPSGRTKENQSPKLKPRLKLKFGQKSMAEKFSVKVGKIMKQRGIMLWLSLIVVMILAAQALFGLFELPPPMIGPASTALIA